MACSSCDPPSSSKTACSLRASLRDFTSLLSSHVILHSSERPEKPKSRLDLYLSAHDEFSVCALPSLSMFPARNAPPSPTLIPCGSRKRSICSSVAAEQTAIYNLSYPINYSRSRLYEAPEQLARSVCSSFTSLIEANLRQYFKINVLRQSQDNVCSAESARALAKSFFQENGQHSPIKLMAADVSFSVPNSSGISCSDDSKCDDQELKLDLVMKITFKMRIGGDSVSVPVEGHGSIVANSKLDNALSINRLDVTLDAPSLLFSLREKARLVAWKAITASTNPLPHAATKAPKTVPAVQPVKRSYMVSPCSSPALAPKRRLCLDPEEHERIRPSLHESCPPKDIKGLSDPLPPKKRLCVRSTLPNGTVATQSPLALLTGVAVLANLKNRKEK